MKLRYLTTECLEALRENVAQNLQTYRAGQFNDLQFVKKSSVEIEGDFSEVDASKGDVLNAIALFEDLRGIKVETARSENFWVALTHGPLLEYSRARWPISDAENTAVSNVRDHFFAKSVRLIESRNAVSRLYWAAELASRVPNHTMEEVIEVIFSNKDIQINFIERPNLIQSSALFSSIVGCLKQSLRTDRVLIGRKANRSFMKEISQVCGSVAVECLPQTMIDKLIGDIASKVRFEASLEPAT